MKFVLLAIFSILLAGNNGNAHTHFPITNDDEVALALGKGSEIIQPLGITVCGGLAISTLLTLIIVPMSLFYLNQKKDYSKKLSLILIYFIVAGLTQSDLYAQQPQKIDLNKAHGNSLEITRARCIAWGHAGHHQNPPGINSTDQKSSQCI